VLASPGIGCGNLWCCLSPRCVSRAKSALPTTPTNARGPSQGPGLKRRPRSNKTPYQPRPARPPDSPVRQQRSARDTHKSTSSVARRTWRPGSDIYTPPACVLASSRVSRALHAGTRCGTWCFWKELNAAVMVHARPYTAYLKTSLGQHAAVQTRTTVQSYSMSCLLGVHAGCVPSTML
jgi:hypothetical protein